MTIPKKQSLSLIIAPSAPSRLNSYPHTPGSSLQTFCLFFNPCDTAIDLTHNRSGTLHPWVTSSLKSLNSSPVNLMASRVGGNSRLRVSNNFSALRAARANSSMVGKAATINAVRAIATNNTEILNHNSGSIKFTIENPSCKKGKS